MPVTCDYRSSNKNFLANEERFIIKLKKKSNSKHINIKFIIVSIFMLISLIMGLIFAEKDIFLISALLKLFGHQVYNKVILVAFLIVGGVVGLGISYLFEHYMNTFISDYSNAHISLPLVAEKVSELILIPLVFAIREILSNKSFFMDNDKQNLNKDIETKKFTGIFLKRLFNFMTEEYGFNETFSKEKIEEYFKMDFEELSKKLFKLDFVLPVYSKRRTIKYDLSFLKKDFKENYCFITGPEGEPAYNSDKNKNKVIEEEMLKILNIIDGKIKKKSHLRESIFSKVKKNKSHMNNPVTKNIDNQAEQDKRKKIIEITD